jgi:putative peptide-modifying radical SAM enzyme
MKEFDNNLDKKFKFDFSAPDVSQVSEDKLRKFLNNDKNPVLIFYGGEPLLEAERIMKLIDSLKDTDVKFRIQTNGKLFDKLPIKYFKKIEKILVSIDGDKERTDFNRGGGTYKKVMENIALIKKEDYNGEIIARMTISLSDIYEQVKHLIDTGFTSIHWQLDAGFFKFDFNRGEFEKFVEEYNKSITKLIKFWIKDMKTNKRVLRLYPFVAIIESLLKGEKTKLRCGAGHSGYAITTDGKIVACPIMNNIKDFEAGTLNNKPEELKKFDVGGECLTCDIKDLCGGRCLYWNKAGLWPEEGNKLICKTIKHLISELQKRIPEIEKIIKEGVIVKKDFEYEKYFGPEIIP